jgi:hypothetical protein
MKMTQFTRIPFALILMATVPLFVACEEKSTQPEEHILEVQFSYTPDPATANTAIEFLFEVEENGVHTAVTMFSCEVEKEGTGNHLEVMLEEEHGEAGHYGGLHTFSEAATYEVHFEFMHDNEMEQRIFEITVTN